MYKNKLLSLSEQEFLDCDNESSGCQGGYSYYAFQYARSFGANFENEYPYEKTRHQCRRKNHYPENIIKSLGTTRRSERSLSDQLAHGPFVVSVCGNNESWKNYKCGLITYRDCDCHTNHAVYLYRLRCLVSFSIYFCLLFLGRNCWNGKH